jgi:hypothetical protein
MSAPPAQFSHQVTRLQFPKDVHFGDDISIWIAKVGDVALGNMYLRVDWPNVAAPVDDSAGTRMIEFVELRYENDLLERHYGESLEIMNDLSVPAGKQPVLTTLLGKGITSNLTAYYIRMPFKLNLPLCALDKAPVFRIKFRPSQEFSTLNWTAPIRVNLFVDYVYVTKAERDYFKTAKIDYLTHTIQRLQFTVGANNTKSMFLTEFTRPVKELYWVVQTDGAAAYDYTNAGAEQLVSLRLQFNGIDVILPEIGTPLFLRTIQGLESHTRVPDRFFYMYPFALDPEHPTQPTGSVNMSALTRQLHTLELTPCTSSRQVRVYAVTHNVVRIANGAATSLFDTVQEGGTTLFGFDPYAITPAPAPPAPSAGTITGGTLSTVSGYKVHTFTTTGPNAMTVTGGSVTVQILIVAGGGAPGDALGDRGSGGGGGGGVYYTSSCTLTPGTYTVNVGIGGLLYYIAPTVYCLNGGNSNIYLNGSLILYDVPGGGHGGLGSAAMGNTGGSGGGATDALAAGPISGGAGIAPFGYSGGSASGYFSGGGGGGAGQVGGSVSVYGDGGNGGDGLPSSISGSTVYYGAGGPGVGFYIKGNVGLGGNGPNSGGGGSGYYIYGGQPQVDGASGIVIVSEAPV